jgi:hypothetical protein
MGKKALSRYFTLVSNSKGSLVNMYAIYARLKDSYDALWKLYVICTFSDYVHYTITIS